MQVEGEAGEPWSTGRGPQRPLPRPTGACCQWNSQLSHRHQGLTPYLRIKAKGFENLAAETEPKLLPVLLP